MKLITNLLTCTLSVWCLSVCAQSSVQTDFKLKSLAPTSPEAATLGKFGDIPVGLYTGVPNISVPLYTLKLKNFELPISLSYNSSGIKVEEMAPNTGLGWALNAGGNISQSVNGLNDLFTLGFPKVFQDTIPDIVLNNDVLTYQSSTNDGGPLYVWAKKIADGTVDSQPDLFYYSYPGGSGKFYIDQHSQAHPVPFTAVKINVPQIESQPFSIIDEQGRKFIYAAGESTETSNNCGNPSINSTKLLSKIELPDNEVINFNYTSVDYSYAIQPSVSRNQAKPGVFSEHYFDCTTPTLVASVSSARLASITSSDGHEILFKYQNNRTDLPGTQSLDTIIVKNGNKVIAEYTFNYSYFITAENGNADYRRLKLLSVANQNGGVYRFDYNESITLPNRMSFAQDHWGYYNGKNSNPGLLPIEPEYNFVDGADRNVDSTYSQAGMLQKITYPTGGYTKFTFEQNDFYFTGNEYSFSTSSYGVYGQDNQLVTTSFTIPSGTDVVGATVHFNDGSGSSGGTGLGDEPVDPATTVSISGNGINQNLYNGLSSNGTIYLSLSPGTYTLSVNASGAVNGAYCTVDILAKQTTAVAKNKLIGGLRIKTLANRASANDPEEIKTYVYRQKADPAKSSGQINYYPSYTSTYDRLHYIDGVTCDTFGNPLFYGFYKQVTSSVYPLGAIKGGSVGYTFVTALNGATGENGKTESTFTFTPSSGGSISFPLVPFIDHDYENGLLLRQVDYRNSNGTFQPLTQMRSFYSIQPESTFWNYHYAPSTFKNNYLFRGRGEYITYRTAEQHCGLVLYPATFTLNDYRIESQWVRQDSTISSNYNYNAAGVLTDSVVAFKHLTYNNPAHLLPNVTTTQASNHNTIQITNSYPQDYAAGTSPAIDSLVAQHRITATLQSQVNNNSTITTVKNVYKNWGNGIIEPEFVQSQYNSQPVENRLQYYGYDDVGNILSASQYGGPPVAYHWGYNKQYPIAECKNALSDEFYYEGFEESAAAGVTTGTAHTGNKYINTGSGTYSTSDKLAPDYHGKSYVISYWSKNGSGVWVYSGKLPYTGQILSGQLDDIRIYPKDAQIATSTYEPLVGVTSTTDSKGETTYYDYDSFMRLMNIRDKDGKVLKHVDYHYQNN